MNERHCASHRVAYVRVALRSVIKSVRPPSSTNTINSHPNQSLARFHQCQMGRRRSKEARTIDTRKHCDSARDKVIKDITKQNEVTSATAGKKFVEK